MTLATVYPSKIDNNTSLPAAINSVTSFDAAVINRLRDAIIAIQTELGVKPSGIYTTVRARLDSLENALNNISGGGSGFVTIAGDIGGTSINPLVIGIQNHPVSSTTPTAGQTLIYSGSTWVPSDNFLAQNIITSGGVIAGPSILGSVATQLFDLTGIAIINGITAPSVSDPGQAIMYFNSTTNRTHISEDGYDYTLLVENFPLISTTTTYNATNDDVLISVGTLSAPISINLPATPYSRKTIIVKDSNGSAVAHNITVDSNGNNIDGSSTALIDQNYASITIVFDGSNWGIL